MAIPRAFSRQFSRAGVIALFSAGVFAGSSCEKVPLLAPSGSAITLTPAGSTTTDQEVPIGVLVLEVKATTPPPTQGGQGGNNNATPTTGGGTPVHDGTLVTFTVTGGTIAPPEARTVDGRMVVTFIPAGAGKFTITARSGTAQATHEITVNDPTSAGGGQ